MCHYYRWSCPRCRVHQDCICRCYLGRVHVACTRTSEPSALPDSAPPMACQRCGFVRGLHSQPPHDLPEAKPTAACQIEHPTDHQATTPTQLLPPAHDVFWLRPQARLSDTAATLTRYEEERKAIFENPKKILPVTHLPRKDGEATSMPGSTLTCDQAWLRLQEAVCSRRRSGVKLEGGGGS